MQPLDKHPAKRKNKIASTITSPKTVAQMNDAVSVQWGRQLCDAVVTAFEPARGHKCIQVEFQRDGSLGWVAAGSIHSLSDPNQSTLPRRLNEGDVVYAQFVYQPGMWYAAKIISVKQGAEDSGEDGLLFWVRFDCDSTHQWCRREHLNPRMLAPVNLAASISLPHTIIVEATDPVCKQPVLPESNC